MATIPFIYVALLITWVVMIVGYIIRDWIIKSIVSIFFMTVGVFILINGIEGISNLAVDALGITHIAIGFYVIVTESYELYKDM